MTPHERLRELIREHGLTEAQGMHLLQEHCIVSDNAVWINDCHPSDVEYALLDRRWLEGVT